MRTLFLFFTFCFSLFKSLETKRLLFLFTFHFSLFAFACDVCNVFEYANQRNQNYVGIFYRNRFFNGYQSLNQPNKYQFFPNSDPNARMEHVPENEQGTQFNRSAKDFEFYQTIELRANYAISKKFNIQLIAPFGISNVYFSDVSQYIGPTSPIIKKDSAYGTSGIGDIILMADYIKTHQTGNIKHIIKPGFGLKLPTGSVSRKHNEGQIMSYDLQPGTGSMDLLFRLNYLVTNDKWGADVFTNYRVCTESSTNMQFGNRFNVSTFLYYTLPIKNIKILPRIGLYAETAAQDFFEKNRLKQTGGHTFFYQFGADIMVGKFVFQTIFQKPFYENLNGDVQGNAGRLAFGLIFNFD